MTHGKVNIFGKLGNVITKRKYAIIAIWIILLAIILPVVLTATGVSSLQMNESTATDLESAKANDIITAQFSKAVANDSLVIVITTNNASSMSTQQFIEELSDEINSTSTMSGVENITNVYSIMVPALNGTNEGVYIAYKNANLTYNLLYSVPAIYSQVWTAAYNEAIKSVTSGLQQTNQGVYQVYDNANLTYNMIYGVPVMYTMVWGTAYNQTHDMLVDGLTQANQGVYLTLENANLTANMLYGTPAMYLQFWGQNYAVTSDVQQANDFAYQQTAAVLQAADPQAFVQYTGPLLTAFNATWAQSFLDPSTASWTPEQRAVFASDQTTQLYINTVLAGNATEQAFVTGLTSALTFQDYLAGNQTYNNAVLTGFAIQTVVAASAGQSSTEFVTAAFNLGPNPSAEALSILANTIIGSPDTYNMGTNFISTFNEVAYNQTSAMLYAADPTSYAQYTGPLLEAYNATWSMSFLNPQTATLTPMERANVATTQTVQLYLDSITDATTKSFATALTNALTFQDFLTNTQDQNNAELRNFAINYVAQSGSVSATFVSAAFDLGRSPSYSEFADLADNIVWYSDAYHMGDNFIDTFNDVCYDQAKTILKDADEESFNDYTSHLLSLFDSAWTSSFKGLTQYLSANARAQYAIEKALPQFIDQYFSDNKDFVDAVADTFTFQDFIDAKSSVTNLKAQNLAIEYVANQSGLSPELVEATFNLGENASISSVKALASNLIWNPEPYNLGQQFNELLESFISPDNEVTLISITFDHSGSENLLALRQIIADKLAQNPNSDVQAAQVTGNDALDHDFMQSTQDDLDVILPITIVLLVVATALFFRSIVTPIITLGTIGVGLGVSQIFPYLVGTYINQVDYTISTVLLTVLIGVGTDYSIFVIARHREERINGLPLFAAIKKSITWAGESIVTSGATVIISFLALAATSMVFLQTMGLIVGLGVIVTLLASLTFAPALTAILGDRIFWPNSGKRFERYAQSIQAKNARRGGYFARSGAFSVKHGKVIILVAVLITVPAFYVYSTTVPTYNLIGSASNSLESISASNTLTDSFGGGRLMPTYVVVTFSEPLVNDNGDFNMGEMATLQSISSSIDSHAGVQEVTGPTMPFGQAVDYQTITNDTDATTYSTMLGSIGADNQSALITVRFHADPYSTEAMDYAKDIRASLHADYDDKANVTAIYLGGTTGSSLDNRISFEQQFNSILPIVALGVGLVLFFVLGSLILPVFAILSVLMSIVWTLAVTVIVFQAAYGYGLLFMTPLILFVLLLGLGMDYNIFILTRIREEATKGENLKDAIVNAIQQTGGIITAAAIILAGSLGALMLSSNMMMREMGFAFAFSILIDALVVRTYLVPAVMATFGKWNWYNPIKRLRRINDFNEKPSPQQTQQAPTEKTE
jgi:RND superfamily putative drug exporter